MSYLPNFSWSLIPLLVSALLISTSTFSRLALVETSLPQWAQLGVLDRSSGSDLDQLGYLSKNGLDEAQAGIKIARRNINNLRWADDTNLMAESEELKSLSMKVKEDCEKAGLKLNIQKTSIMASDPITSCQIDGETMETVTDFISGDSNITEDGDCSHEIKRSLLLGRKVMTNLDSILKAETLLCQQRFI